MSRKIITGESVLGVTEELNEKSQIEGPDKAESDGENLWIYAATVYAAPDVARACLRAQDDLGLDVNLLLFAAWLAVHGVKLEPDTLHSAAQRCDAWRERVVKPLRIARRAWRDTPPHEQVYAAIKALELEAERHQLCFLGRFGEQIAGRSLPVQFGLGTPKADAEIRANLQLFSNANSDREGAAILEDLSAALSAATAARAGM